MWWLQRRSTGTHGQWFTTVLLSCLGDMGCGSVMRCGGYNADQLVHTVNGSLVHTMSCCRDMGCGSVVRCGGYNADQLVHMVNGSRQCCCLVLVTWVAVA